VQQQVGEEEERVLISEILIQNKDGQNLEDLELLATAQQALKACKPNFALTTSEVQEDVHRIIDTGFFSSCMPSAEDTRDGVRLIFKVRVPPFSSI
jgi:outer membrane protein insertion porin family